MFHREIALRKYAKCARKRACVAVKFRLFLRASLLQNTSMCAASKVTWKALIVNDFFREFAGSPATLPKVLHKPLGELIFRTHFKLFRKSFMYTF